MQRIAKQALDRFLLQVVDLALAGAIFFVPLLMGGRHAIGQLALTALAVAAAWAWTVRQCLRDDAAWRPTAAVPLVLAGLALVVLQIVPLPPWLLTRLAPRAADFLPLWSASGGTQASLGYWPCLSFTPAETRAALVVFLDYVLLFFVAAQRIRHVEDVERLLRWCALTAIVMASFGVVQFLAGNGKFFWFHEHPFSNTSKVANGSFSNRNHFAQFLALGIGPLIWWLQDAVRRTRGQGKDIVVYLLGLSLGIVLFAGLLSLSRGGIAVMFLAAAICTAVCYRTASLGRRFVAVMAAAGVLIGVSLAIFGFDRVGNRLEDLTSGSLERLDHGAGRRTIWATAAKAIPDSVWLGFGAGSFREVYPMYTNSLVNKDIEPTHAENCYLQGALETGVAGLGLTLAAIVLCASWCVYGVRSSVPTRLRLCAAAIAGSLAASAVHAAVDFVWYVPACMAIVAILAACALRVWQLSRVEGWSVHRPFMSTVNQSVLRTPYSPLSLHRWTWATAAAALTCVGGWMIFDRIGPAVAQTYWDEFLVARSESSLLSSTPPHYNGGAFGDDGNSSEAEAAKQRRWISRLENAVRWQPTHVRAHLALAETHRRLFDALQTTSENPMSLANIRDAAVRSQFPSREALMDWLSRAVGKHWVHLEQALDHTRNALALCPLEGRAYVYLAELSFLYGADDAARAAYLEQAMRVRPFDGDVLYAVGTEALLAGDHARWLDYSKRAFHSGRRRQRQIIDDLAASTPAENLPALIECILREFQPDLQGVRFLHNACQKRCSPEQLAPLARFRAEKAEIEARTLGSAEATKVWLEAQRLHGQLRDDVEALRCVRNALQCDPGSYNVHYQLALCLMNRQLFAEAESHLRWCLQRKPDNQAVQDKFREALKGRLDGRRRAATKGEPLL